VEEKTKETFTVTGADLNDSGKKLEGFGAIGAPLTNDEPAFARLFFCSSQTQKKV
jgi:hypothetical protein